MFSKTVIDADLFLDLPLTAQALYFHLSMRADDDGFVNNAKKIQRMIGASEDDAKLLLAKQFLIPFDSGVVVIRHWRMHNYIQRDRYKETIYTDEKNALCVDKNGVYTGCIQGVHKADTQDRLEIEIDLGNSKVITPPLSPKGGEGSRKRKAEEYSADFLEFWEVYPKRVGKGAAFSAWQKIHPSPELQAQILDAVKAQLSSEQWYRENGRFIPNPSTWLNQRRWEDEATVQIASKQDISQEEFFRGI